MALFQTTLSALCRDFCQEIKQITHEADLFLTQFHTQERVRFWDAEEIKEQYLSLYGSLLTAVLSSLERTDGLALRLSQLLISTDCTEAIEDQTTVNALWVAYEQYRADVSNFCESTQKYWTDKSAIATQGITPLVFAMRALIASQNQTHGVFLKHIL